MNSLRVIDNLTIFGAAIVLTALSLIVNLKSGGFLSRISYYALVAGFIFAVVMFGGLVVERLNGG